MPVSGQTSSPVPPAAGAGNPAGS
ncbi:MAG: hypothetical protein RJB55_2093, partial [Verrucomicrobiota bacterium]